ncbi:MAG: copper amine oxidase N-terminal domain-containing protein [Cellulosilyticum sp.]|nr:copper amine oxidase N-terminal domain-containing protein [Cellulosilyticum sp.]
MIFKKYTAYLMAAVMSVSLWSNTYYAASFNHVNKVLTVVSGETLIGSEAPLLNIRLIDELEVGAIFYVELTGGKWIDVPYNAQLKDYNGNGTLEVKRVNAQKLQVKVMGENLASGISLQIPMQLQMIGETATATIKSNNTVVSSGSFTIAKASSYKGSVSAGEIPTTTKSGVMADLVIEEPFSKAFSKAVTMGKSNVIELRLNHNAYAFSLKDSNVCLTPLEGFEDISMDGFEIKQIDPQTLQITLPDTSMASYTGAFKLSGIYIQLTDKLSSMDTLTVTLTGDLIQTTTVDVLEVMDYDITLSGAVQAARAGSKQKLKFELEEQVDDSLIRNRPTFFTFTDGITFETVDNKVAVWVNGTLGYYPTVEKDGKVIGFEISRLPQDLTKYSFEVEAVVLPNASGNIKVTAEGRSLVETLEAILLKVYAPFVIEIHEFNTLVGLKDQVGGKVVVKETKAGELIQGEKIVLELEESNIKYSNLPKITVESGDLRIGEANIVGNRIEIPVTRSSHVASTIVIKDFKVTLDQTIATGNYALAVGGGALSHLESENGLVSFVKKTFIKVNETSVEVPTQPKDEVIEEEVPKIETKVIFTLGKTTYQNGETIKVMDAAPYASSGRTMLPIKYVAEALGISGENIQWNHTTKTVTILGDKRISLCIGSQTMTVDGEKIMMSTMPEVVNGRTFVPVAEISRALNVETNWDHITKKVTFTI